MTTHEVILKVGLVRQPGLLYFIDKKGDICSTPMSRGKKPGVGSTVVVEPTHVAKEIGYMYFLDKFGDIVRVKMMRRTKKVAEV